MIFGFVSENLKTQAVAVAFSMAWLEGDVEQRLAAFRGRCTGASPRAGMWPDGRIRLGVDVRNWLRPGAACSPERLFCHVYCRGKGQAQMIQG
jgi:hypothetical protein